MLKLPHNKSIRYSVASIDAVIAAIFSAAKTEFPNILNSRKDTAKNIVAHKTA